VDPKPAVLGCVGCIAGNAGCDGARTLPIDGAGGVGTMGLGVDQANF
jgi:hypothetical protein